MKVSKDIENLIPYIPGKPISETKRELGLEKVIKLASNENPLGISPRAKQAMQDCLEDINLYPDGSCFELKEKLSKIVDLGPEWISFGNGSNEILDILIRIYCEPGDSILTSKSAFIVYKLCAQAIGVKTVETPLTPEYGIDISAMTDFVQNSWTDKHKLIFIPNPNNPTGTYLNKTEMEKLLDVAGNREDLLIVFDEAYNEFVRAEDCPDTLGYLKKYNNVVLIRTLSKVYGLAGLRVGYILAQPQVIDYFNRVRNPFNVNSLAQVGAMAALDDKDFLKRSQKIVWEGLDYFYEALEKLGYPYVKSQGNFVLFDTKGDAKVIAQELLKKGVIVRPVGGYGFPHHLRMSVGLPEENKAAIEALSSL